jgi:hypothetical protein
VHCVPGDADGVAVEVVELFGGGVVDERGEADRGTKVQVRVGMAPLIGRLSNPQFTHILQKLLTSIN